MEYPQPSAPVLHQFHQHCLQLKKHISSYNICCMMVTTGCLMAVMLSCFVYLVIIPLWSITTVMMCMYPWPGEADPCPGMHAHVLRHPGCHMQEPIPLPACAHSTGARGGPL